MCNVETEVKYTNEGETVSLNCPFGNIDATTWDGPEGVQLSINGQINPNAKRKDRLYAFQTNTSNAYNLQIKNVTKDEDEGVYLCTVSIYQKQYRLKFKSKYNHYI